MKTSQTCSDKGMTRKDRKEHTMKKKVTGLLGVLTGIFMVTSCLHTTVAYAEETNAQNTKTVVTGETEIRAEDEQETQESSKENVQDLKAENNTENTRSGDAAQDVEDSTQKMLEEYQQLLNRANLLSLSSYEEELANFPADYQALLQGLHAAHPNWVFVAVDTGLDWNTVIEMESRSGISSANCYSLLPDFSGKLLLSKAATDYDVETGTYIVKDGSEWVSASKPAVAYYMDPRNFLTKDNIFQFETFAYNGTFHTLAGVESVLKGTDLYNRTISYVNTAGTSVTTELTYGEAIYAAGIKYGISPILLASKIRQETSGSLSNGSISGTYSYGGASYRGYYNFYNIGANGVSSSQGSAIANGLIFAKGGSNGTDTSYGRPWTSPILSVDGGAQYMTDSYLRRGQNTIYFKKFNTVAKPYYANQYMQNLYGAEAEGRNAYNSYAECGILNSEFVFYIPVYQNMPAYQSTVTIEKAVTTGQTTDELSLRTGPSTAYPILTKIPHGATITVTGGVYTDHTVSVTKRLYDPYWLKVSYGSYTGYSSAEFIVMHAGTKLAIGGTTQLNVSCDDNVIYYETSNPKIATVSSTGLVTGTGLGYCNIYAVNQSGTRLDCVGIGVIDQLATPELTSAANGTKGVNVTWSAVQNAEGYYVYRKTSGTSWKKIATVPGSSTVKYIDTTAQSGTAYTYTVRAYRGSTLSKYDAAGVCVKYLSVPAMSSVGNGTAGVTVKWNKVTGASGYYVYRKSGSGSWKHIGTISDGSKISFVDKTAASGTTYTYTVRAYSGSTKSGYDTAGKSVKYLSAPAMSSAGNGTMGVTVKWSKVTGASGYYVYRKTGSGNWKHIGTVSGGSKVSFVDKTAASGTTYTYTVRAYSGSTKSGYDAAGKGVKYLSKPVLSGAVNSGSGITVKWGKVTGATNYYVYRKTDGSSWKRIATVGSGTVSYLDKNVQSGAAYTYTVRAYAGGVLSAYDSAGKRAVR